MCLNSTRDLHRDFFRSKRGKNSIERRRLEQHKSQKRATLPQNSEIDFAIFFSLRDYRTKHIFRKSQKLENMKKSRTTVTREQKWANQERKLHIKLEKYLLVSPKSRFYWDKKSKKSISVELLLLCVRIKAIQRGTCRTYNQGINQG